MKIIQKDNGKAGVFEALMDDAQVGEMTYIWEGKDTIVIDHTGVGPQYEGQGIGRQLFDKAVEFARTNEVKIVPVCPFVVALFERLPETNDVLAD
ncbi:MAG: N-acetyltransferase [Candidatus Symbiothrix sp.]|jgi:predicted GNAT family acetyltransferase|nr:N-acetyltransferase [Candidatus Symbiothrix sp.]